MYSDPSLSSTAVSAATSTACGGASASAAAACVPRRPFLFLGGVAATRQSSDCALATSAYRSGPTTNKKSLHDSICPQLGAGQSASAPVCASSAASLRIENSQVTTAMRAEWVAATNCSLRHSIPAPCPQRSNSIAPRRWCDLEQTEQSILRALRFAPPGAAPALHAAGTGASVRTRFDVCSPYPTRGGSLEFIHGGSGRVPSDRSELKNNKPTQRTTAASLQRKRGKGGEARERERK